VERRSPLADASELLVEPVNWLHAPRRHSDLAVSRPGHRHDGERCLLRRHRLAHVGRRPPPPLGIRRASSSTPLTDQHCHDSTAFPPNGVADQRTSRVDVRHVGRWG